ncbi:transketolase [Candidatus Woesearchaeota archaeon]|nr:transketolase [Candidatus Woesearchaeota archaeon]
MASIKKEEPKKEESDVKKLQLTANQIRQDIISMLAKAGSGHPGGSLGMVDVFTALYFKILKHKPSDPFWKDRDILVLSNGHICPVRYAAMANAGYFSRKELLTLRKLGTRLQGHPHRTSLPGIETTSGPLGSGLSQAAGMAQIFKLEKKNNYVYCIVSDGEQDAGQNWEAVMYAAKYKLDNLIAIMDRNDIQIDGTTTQIMPLEPLKEKYLAFNWDVVEVDAHNISEIVSACNKAKQNNLQASEKPMMIIAHSVLGKGVSFMENKPEWHGKAPTEEEAKKALQELAEERKRIETKT